MSKRKMLMLVGTKPAKINSVQLFANKLASMRTKGAERWTIAALKTDVLIIHMWTMFAESLILAKTESEEAHKC